MDFKSWLTGDYRWLTYEDLDSTADYFGRGLRNLGLQPRDKLCVFADTRYLIKNVGFWWILRGI